jgi:hypothetical protein
MLLATPYAGITQIRFEGYYLSQTGTPFCLKNKKIQRARLGRRPNTETP